MSSLCQKIRFLNILFFVFANSMVWASQSTDLASEVVKEFHIKLMPNFVGQKLLIFKEDGVVGKSLSIVADKDGKQAVISKASFALPDINGDTGPEVVVPPKALQLKISTENEVKLKDMFFLPSGTVGFNGAYVSAIIFDESIKNCSIFIFSNGGLYGAYGGAPCEFVGAAEIDFSGGPEGPDVYYKVNVFSPGLGASVNDLVAFYYDFSKKSFCESRLLSTWKFNGKINVRPKLSDGICGYVN